MFKTRNYIPQIDERDCGVSALAMVIRQYGSTVSLAHLRGLAKTDMEGTTALGIVKAAEELGFTTQAVRADMTLFDMADVPYLFIVHVIKNGDLPHYYVVLGANKKSIKIADPDDTVGVTKLPRNVFEAEWTKVALFIAPAPEYKPTVESKGSLLAFIPILMKQRGLIINIIIASVLVTVISIIGSYFLQGIIDSFIPNAMKTTLGIISMGLIAAYIIQQILTFAQNYLLTVMGQRLSIDVILSYIKHIFELPMSFFATRRTGEIISRFTDANSIIDALASTMLSLFLDVWILIIVGTVLAIQNMQLFLITLVSIPVYAAIILLFMKPFERMNNDVMQSNSMLSSSIIENINGIETIKSLTSEGASYQKIDREFVETLNKSFKYQKATLIQTALKDGMELILNVVILWVGAQLVMKGQISIGELVTYNALLAYFTNPLQTIINLQTKLQSAKVANNRLNEVYLVESEFKKKQATVAEVALDGDIVFENINFNYGFGKPTLNDVSARIKKGEKVALVGISGSGKTTLIKLLVNFFQPNSGRVIINGNDIADIDKKQIRQSVNYVPQQPFIFTGTIMENLTLGARAGVTEEDIVNAVEIAEIRNDIESMQLKYNSELSESSGMSGGQKQRIAIARAILTGAPVIIFDESTSNLDVLTEKKIMDNLLAMADKTIIFIAHRLTIAERAENVLVMDKGRLIEQGSHKELMEQRGFYYELFNK